MAVHGVSRGTRDIDLLTLDPRCLDPATWVPLEPEGIATTLRRGEDDDPLAGVVRLAGADQTTLDVVVGRAAWQAEALERAGEREIEGVGVPVVGAPDLILLKLYAGGSQDMWDIEQLLAGPGRPALVADVEARVAALPDDARRLWARIAGSR
jgi:hypothetical protein